MVAAEGLGPGGDQADDVGFGDEIEENLGSGTLKAFTEHTVDVIETWYQDPIDFAAYSTDSNVPLSLGIVANTVGTVRGALAHTREEWIELSSLENGLRIALALMLDYVEV